MRSFAEVSYQGRKEEGLGHRRAEAVAHVPQGL